MTDVNEQSFSAGSTTDSAPARHAKPPRSEFPAPIWRFRPTLQPVVVVKTIKTQIIPKIVLALRRRRRRKPRNSAEQAVRARSSNSRHWRSETTMAPPSLMSKGFWRSGMSVEAIFLGFAGAGGAATRRTLGIDATDFANVTLGVSRLQRIMRQLW